MIRLLRLLRRILPDIFLPIPPSLVMRRPGVIADFEFMRGSFRPGEAFDPLASTLEE